MDFPNSSVGDGRCLSIEGIYNWFKASSLGVEYWRLFFTTTATKMYNNVIHHLFYEKRRSRVSINVLTLYTNEMDCEMKIGLLVSV